MKYSVTIILLLSSVQPSFADICKNFGSQNGLYARYQDQKSFSKISSKSTISYSNLAEFGYRYSKKSNIYPTENEDSVIFISQKSVGSGAKASRIMLTRKHISEKCNNTKHGKFKTNGKGFATLTQYVAQTRKKNGDVFKNFHHNVKLNGQCVVTTEFSDKEAYLAALFFGSKVYIPESRIAELSNKIADESFVTKAIASTLPVDGQKTKNTDLTSIGIQSIALQRLSNVESSCFVFDKPYSTQKFRSWTKAGSVKKAIKLSKENGWQPKMTKFQIYSQITGDAYSVTANKKRGERSYTINWK
jgi:hypothetical protein